MNKKIVRAVSSLVTAAMLFSAIPSAIAEGTEQSVPMTEISENAAEAANQTDNTEVSADAGDTEMELFADSENSESFFFKADDLENGDYTSNFKSGRLSFVFTKNKAASVSASSKTVLGEKFAKTIKLNGAANMEFDTSNGGTLTIYAASANKNSVRSFTVGSNTLEFGGDPEMKTCTVNAGTVSITATEGLNVYGVRFVSRVAAPSTDEEWAAYIKDNTVNPSEVIKTENIDLNAVTDSFELSDKYISKYDEANQKEADVTWTSSNEKVVKIDGYNAVVTRPRFYENAEKAVLTAEIKIGEQTVKKTFNISVAPLENPEGDEEYMIYAERRLKGLGFDVSTNKVASADMYLPTEIILDNGTKIADISWKSSDTAWVTDDGQIVQYGDSSHSVTLTAVITVGQQKKTNEYNITIKRAAAAKAFPGAQGYGTQTRGGAGGYVCHVTSLGAQGPGTLKEALEEKSGRRIIVFDVGGTIDLTSVGRALRISGEDDSNLTIAGQTAPGEGIQLKGYGLSVSGVHDVIIRNISIRIGNVRKAGDTYQSDPLSAQGVNKRVVFDHLSLCWAVDMGFRAYGQEVTMSNCMISKGLYWNTPHEKGKHNYAGIFGPKYGSFYGNYIADCGQRAPRICDNEYIDIRNNVVSNSKYSFDICNYEWMGANTKYNVVNNVVLYGSGAPGQSSSNAASGGTYKYFQGRTYSGGVMSYSVNNYDNNGKARSMDNPDKNVEGALWTGKFSDNESNVKRAANELKVFNADGYTNVDDEWKNMIFPSDISMAEYDSSVISKEGNTLVNYPFAAPNMITYSADEAAKRVLTSAGAVIGRGENDDAPRKGILDNRYLAEGKTRLQVLSDYSKASGTYGIKIDNDYTGDTAYGLKVQTHTVYEDERGATVYDVDGIDIPDASGMTVKEQYKFVSCDNHLESLYAVDKDNNKYRLVLRAYEDNDGIYDTFDLYDISNNKLTKPADYANAIVTADKKATGYIPFGSIEIHGADWGDGPGNYNHANAGVTDGNLGTEIVDTEWTADDWPQLPVTYRDGDFDSNGDGIPDFFVELMGWNKRADYSSDKDISRLDYEGRGYTNIEYYINDYCAGDTESADSMENEAIEAENVRDGSSKYNTHKSHEILFNTVRRAKAEVYYCEGDSFDMDKAMRAALNTSYDISSEKYSDAKDFETYFSAILDNLKPNTTYTYKIMTYSDTGVENLSTDTYKFTTKESSTGKPERPRVTRYIPFDEKVTLNFEPGSKVKGYKESAAGSHSVKALTNNTYDTKTDHYILRYSENKDMSNAKSVTIPSTASTYELKGLTNNKTYYLDLRAVSADGTESDGAIYNKKKAAETEDKDKDGNPVYKVDKISVKNNGVIEYPEKYDMDFNTLAIVPTKYVINEKYSKTLKESGIGEGDTTKFITVYGDEKDWYIYTLGGIPIPSTLEGEGDDPMLMLSDQSHDHGFTYAKKFDTLLDGKSTIRARLMIKGEELDPENQAPELRFYIQQDSADLGDTDADVETNTTNEATAFGNIVSLQSTKNEIIFNGEKSIAKYSDDTWYDIKFLMDGDTGTCSLYINDSLIGKDWDYSDSATSNSIARWEIKSRLAGTEDVYIDYMYAYSGWDEPVEDAEATPKPDDTVQEGTSGKKPSVGGGGGGSTGPKATKAPSDATPDPNSTPNPNGGSASDNVPNEIVKSGFIDMDNFGWAEEAVSELHKRGVAYGITEKEFAPQRDITRAEFITLLMRGFELIGEDAVCNFDDVPDGSWCYPAVAMAYSMGIVKGYDDRTFGVNDKVSRQDMAVMVVRLMQNLGFDTEKVTEYQIFDDENEIDDYAKDAVRKLYESGIINGVGENRFDPKGTANRAASAKIIYLTLKDRWDEQE